MAMSKRRQPPPARQQRSLEELDGPLPATGLAARLPKRVRDARKLPLEQLSPHQLLSLLHQGQGIVHLFPHALAAAEAEPWAALEFHPGDLLLAVLRTDPAHWKPGTSLYARMVALASAAERAASRRPADARSAETEADVRRWRAQHAKRK